jgi:hypothetical protein
MNKLEKKIELLKEEIKLKQTAQYMLMSQVLRFVDDKQYIQLKQFCETYNRKI